VAEPHRQEILRQVWREELPVGELVERLELTYPGVSRHLALLRDAGFVVVRRDGKQRFYRADHDGLGPLKQFLESFWADQLDRLATLAEQAEKA
jgi:DNA-binding transcriptional ArsR family regulator